MSVIIQDNRSVKIYSALADNTLLFNSLSGAERLSQLFAYSLEVASENHAIDLDSLIGTDITVELELPMGGFRYYHGFISHCAHVESSHEHAKYELVIRPWTWFLTQTSDCRIFQNMSVPDIIKKIFNDEGFSDYIESLNGTYDTWVYCVQYRETDFNFVSRLMEQEGIYYYFKHDNGVHKLVLSDSISAHDTVENYAEVPYYLSTDGQIRERDHISHWELRQNLQPGVYATNDYNFEDPKSDLLVSKEASGKYARANYELYDYPGEYPLRGAGERVAGYRMEEIQAQQNTVSGGGNAEGLCAGSLFVLTEAEREDQNQEYLIIESYSAFALDNFDNNGSNETDFRCQISAISSKQPFRAPRLTSKPVVQGPQTAIVVGPAGEEIWTDEHGRVKLQFHWDRYGESDENSSCWIRVSQVHAGSGFGGVDIPRIGEEVIVEHLEGDPDRPIVTGRVYNGDNKPPNELPAQKMVSGLQSRSTPGGGGNNAIMLNDTKGEEDLTIHAQKDANTTVENDRNATIVGGNDSITVQAGTRSVTVKGNTSLTVEEGDRIVDVTGSYTLDTTAEISMQAPTKISLTCGGSTITMEPDKITLTAGGGASLTLDTDALMVSSDGSQQLLDSNVTVQSSGGSEVLLDGSATVTGIAEATVGAPTVTLAGAAGNVKADAAGVTASGPKISLN